MIKARSKLSGGSRLRAWVRKQKRVARDSGATVEVGFLDKRIDALAQTHEFGQRFGRLCLT